MTSNNPYAPTTFVDAPTEGEDRQRLRNIASAQRHVNLAVLLYLCLIPCNVLLSIVGNGSLLAGVLFAIAAIGIVIYGAVSVFRLAALFRGNAVAVIYVLGLLVPLLGLILLITISQKATKILTANGIKVGLLGANPKSV
jgi:hypothetical protein